MIFKQLFEPDSSTYTYLIACPDTKEAILLDSVLDTADRDAKTVQDMGLKLVMTLETHVHADHLTGALRLKQTTGSKIAYPSLDTLECMDIGVKEGEPIKVGNSVVLHPLFTPGHTANHHAYVLDTPVQKFLFTGDALLIDACGRTDFQSGDAATLYKSVTEKFFTLADETIVYPGHDYQGRFVSTIAQEKARNPRLGQGKTMEEFVDIMNNLNLPMPRKIKFAVPGNELCGLCPDNVPDEYRKPCDLYDQG